MAHPPSPGTALADPGPRVGWELALARVALVGGLLALSELIWLVELAFPWSPTRVGLLLAQAAALALLAELGGNAANLLAERLLGPRRAPWLLVLACLPAAVVVARALLSGKWVSTLPGVGLMKLALGAALLGGAYLGIVLFRRIPSWPRRKAWGLALGLALVAVGYLDTHVRVGLYAEFHLVLEACIVAGACLLARLLLPRDRPLPPALGPLLACALLSAAVATVTSWSSPDAAALALRSHGMLPRFRRVLVKLSGRGPRAAALPAALPAARPEDAPRFRFQPTPGSEAAALRTNARNLIFLLVDGLRDDHVGSERAATPHLDALIGESLRFTRAYAPSDRTGRSLPGLMSGLPLQTTRALGDARVAAPSWLELLGAAGLRTFANGNCDYLSRKYPEVPLAHAFGAAEVQPSAGSDDAVVEELLAFVAREPGTPFAAYTHWMDVHVRGISADIAQRYRLAVETIDARLGALVAGLRAAGAWENTVLILSADHGYFLGEDNIYLGNHGCRERMLRVPLLLKLPGGHAGGRRVEAPASGLSVGPTAVDLLAPESAWWVGAPSLLLALSDAPLGPVNASEGSIHLLRSGDASLVWDRYLDLWTLRAPETDPEEPWDDPARAAKLRAILLAERDLERRLAALLIANAGEAR